MKFSLILVLLTLSISTCFGQSKKQQILALNAKVDSLNSVLEAERASALKVIFELDKEATDIENNLIMVVKDCEIVSALYLKEIKELHYRIDSLNGKKSTIYLDDNGASIMPIEIGSDSKTKKELLTSAIGKYKLVSITGNTGANTMFDTYKEEGRWVSTSSTNIGGERNKTVNKLTNKDAMLLNDLHIEVNAKLNVKLQNGRNMLFDVPFNDSGMEYKVDKVNKSHFEGYTASTIFIGKQLILLANDNMDFSLALNGNFDLVHSNNMKLIYQIDEDTFYLTIFNGQCCDSSTLKFSKN